MGMSQDLAEALAASDASLDAYARVVCEDMVQKEDRAWMALPSADSTMEDLLIAAEWLSKHLSEELNAGNRTIHPLGERWLQRAQTHLQVKLDSYLHGNVVTYTNAEQAAKAIVKSVASELQHAAYALEESAKQLKADGKGWRAGQAHQAATRARQAAEDLLGT